MPENVVRLLLLSLSVDSELKVLLANVSILFDMMLRSVSFARELFFITFMVLLDRSRRVRLPRY